MKILFICTGNTCRSPMAEGIAKKAANEKDICADFSSAGLFVNDIDGTSDNAIKAMSEIGVDISEHMPTQLTPQMIESADIIVPMTNRHYDALANIGVDSAKIWQFSGDVTDPYMQNIDIYRHCRDELIKYINELLGKINGDKNA